MNSDQIELGGINDPFGEISDIKINDWEKDKSQIPSAQGVTGGSGMPATGEFSTLDEPVSETIKRDLMRIYNKLKIVINPFQLGVQGGADNIEEKRREVRNWDLWGPFIFCLFLSV